MATDISALLREAETHSADTPEFQDWSDAAVCMFPIAPGSTLECLEAVRFDYPSSPGHEFRLQSAKPIDDETAVLLRNAWRAAGGDKDPGRGRSALTIASIEFVRSQLHSVLWMASRLKIYREFRPGIAEQFVERVQSIDWHRGSAVIQANFQVLSVLGVMESAADDLFNWTANVDRSSGEPAFCHRPPATDSSQPFGQEAILAGAAVLWVDAALASSDMPRALAFMSCAANAMWQAGFMSGWEGKEEMLRTGARHAGKKGGAERHRATQELKQWALAEAVATRGSDMEIARSLARRIPSHLGGVSADPERLIYDALRAVAANRRAGGTP
jgi:hypothetical protein